MKRFYLAVIVFLFFPLCVHAEEITNFSAEYEIRSDGSVAVTERIVYDFGSNERRGIFRTIYLQKTNQDGKRFTVSFDAVSVTNDTGAQYPVSESRTGSQVTLRIGDPNIFVSGEQTYVLQYELRGALTYFSDHDELYWNVTGNDWNVPIENVTAHVRLPQPIAPSLLRIECFTGSIGSTEHSCTPSGEDGVVTFTTQEALFPGEGVTIVAGFPKDIVAVLEPSPVLLDNPLVLLALFLVAAFWYLLLPVAIALRWWKDGRDPKPSIGQARVWFSVPKLESGEEVTPAQMAIILQEHVNAKAIVATIVDLAHRGSIRMQKENKTLWIEPTEKTTSTLSATEKELYKALFSKGSRVKTDEIMLYSVYQKFTTDLSKWAVEEKIFVKNPHVQRMFYTGLAGIALSTGNILLFMSSMLFGRNMPKRTHQGANLAALARALKGFLISQDSQYRFQAKEVYLFEKLLPFAVALGIEQIWASRFSNLTVPPPNWYTGDTDFTSVLFAKTISSSFHSVQMSMTATRSSSGFSSGFSGGSSGGGGGGGGGGSW